MVTNLDFYTLLPVALIVAWACVLLLLDVFLIKEKHHITALLTAVGLALALGITLTQSGQSLLGFNGMIALDDFSVFMNALFLVTGLLGVAVSVGYAERMNIARDEYYILMLFSIAGMMLMAQATDLIVVFIALELLSIPLYVLSAFAFPRADSEEAGMKYFLLGAFSSGFLLYGIALIFGATETTSLYAISSVIMNGTYNATLLLIGSGLILVGFGFKIASVPFHMWTPDVYQGAPTSVTAFMSAGAKAAGFAALMRVFTVAFMNNALDITPILWTLSALTMIVGNLIAVSQTNIKRMLAYSSIAQAGYILMAFVPYGTGVTNDALSAGVFFLAAYTITSFGAWAVVIMLERRDPSPALRQAQDGSSGQGAKGLEITDYAGLGRKYPLIGVAMTIFMFSFIGIPPTFGFLGKFYLFRSAIESGYIWLAVIGVLTSLISAYYYLRVVVMMFMRDGAPEVERDIWLDFTVGAMAIATVIITFVPSWLFDWAWRAGISLAFPWKG
jgi:NADH-quinone oxidoreductase subunit N